MPIKDNREYRAMAMTTQSPQKRINTEHYIEGYATTFNIPYVIAARDGIKFYEVIDRHALDEADMSDIIMQYDHEGKVFARLSNKTLGIEPNDKGLFIYADLSKSTASRDMYQEIETKLVTKMSWSFVVDKSKDKYDQNTRTRTIMKIDKVYDVSAVSIPANGDTNISARSWVDGVIEAEKREALERKKQQLKLRLTLERNEYEINGN